MFLILWVLLIAAANIDKSIQDSKDCLAYPPCTCSGSNVYCTNMDFETFPKFKPSNVTGRYIVLRLSNSHLTTIPSGAFSNLSLSNTTDMYLYVGSNDISIIEEGAFNGVEDRLTSIILDRNLFTSVPSELQVLTNLQFLHFGLNPVVSLVSSTETLLSLAESLTTLRLDLRYFQSCPIELNFLHSLTELYLSSLQERHLPCDFLNGFKNTLKILSLENAQVQRIPHSICNLLNLTSLTFYMPSTQINTTVDLTLGSCGANLTLLTHVNLNVNYFGYMPNVFGSFPYMTSLQLMYNHIGYIRSEMIPNDAILQYLNLGYNQLTRIPSAVGKITLRSLSLSNNQIQSVENCDLTHLSNLKTLNLNNNPLEYISPDAFSNNQLLYWVEMKNTKLRLLPVAVADLSSLLALYLDNTPIECTCDMAYLKPWNVDNPSLSIHGSCSNRPLRVLTFIREELSKCP